MKIRVEGCYAGHFYYRITLPDGRRERVEADTWNRSVASSVLTLLSAVYGLKRKNIRFSVV